MNQPLNESPILFNAAMVRAILAGTKTQTRRVVKPQPELREIAQVGHMLGFKKHKADGFWLWPNARERIVAERPYGQPGDRLWVRETFAHIYRDNTRPDVRRDDDVAYKADHPGLDEYAFGSWKPSIHMPRWASRITLEITRVRLQRLNDIGEADAEAEGVERKDGARWRNYISDDDAFTHLKEARASFCSLWVSINGPGSWDANPWIWAIEFRRLAT